MLYILPLKFIDAIYLFVKMLSCLWCNVGLNVEEKLMALGSRNFFLCRNTAVVAVVGSGGEPPTSSCSRAAKKQGLPWLKFMDFNF